MAATSVNIELFLEAAKTLPVLDVRSPAEYSHAHIPGAHNLALFSDEERKVIGTAYKQESRESAIKIGLDAFGPKMRAMVEAAEAICKKSKQKKVLVHCWRGGMRSAAVAWLLDLYGFEVMLLEGGYKAYRQWVISHWQAPVVFKILAGNTGSGKTEILHHLEQSGAAVLDLEDLAKHRGSAFGAHMHIAQPTQEMFENLLAESLSKLMAAFPGEEIWVEDESQRIGDLNIPVDFFRLLAKMPGVFLMLPFEERLERVVQEYCKYPMDKLVNAIIRIKKRLGPLETKTALSSLVEGDLKGCFSMLLKYYDKHYYPDGRPGFQSIDCTGRNTKQTAAILLNLNP